ncbi:MAG: amidohydrolase [Phycisphaerae bacterium]|nr:amidohydrolase [Phycisphaerae bacterium]
MSKIDLHTHVLPERWPDLVEQTGYAGWVRLEHVAPCRARMMIGDRLFREIDERSWSAARRLEDCDRCGVSMQVLSTVPVMFSYWAKPVDALDLSRRLNDHIAELVRGHPTRFAGLGTIPLQEPQLACAELERCVCSLGLAGVEIGTHVEPNTFMNRPEAWNLNDAPLAAVFQTAERLGAAVFVHPWDMMGKERMPRYWLPWLVGMPAEGSLAICSMMFGGVFDRFPMLRVCFAHGGGSFAASFGRIARGFEVRPDLCAVDNPRHPREYVAQADGRPARFWVDSLTHDADALRQLLRLFGAERVALGSDYPFPLGEDVPGAMIKSMSDVSEHARARLLCGTAMEFLGRDADHVG